MKPATFALLTLLAACSSGSKERTKDDRQGAARDDARPVAAAVDDARASPIPADSRVLVLGVTEGWDDPHATLHLYRRGPDNGWQPIGEPWPATLGRAGVAWGRGLHGDGSPDGRSGPVKAEGDGRSPAGAFAVLDLFGYGQEPPDTQMAYTQLTEGFRCVDDPASSHYNRIVDLEAVDQDWQSAEIMRRDDELYRWVIELDHNRAGHHAERPEPGAGSCIFFHVWGGPEATTAGCTAMARPDLEALAARLGPAMNPTYVLLPASELAALADSWQLPRP